MSEPFLSPRTRPVGGLGRAATLWAIGRTVAAVTLAVLVMVPDREIQAKAFKLGLIFENLHQRVAGGS